MVSLQFLLFGLKELFTVESYICPKDRAGAFVFASFSEKEGGLRGGVFQ